MRILILGKIGQLGWELQRTIAPLGEVLCVDFPDIDLTRSEAVRAFLQETSPQVIINATAYTDVDRAEREPNKAMAINGYGPGILAEESRKLNAALIHYSTDYVFDGRLGHAYTENDVPNPLGVYGQSKLAGEQWIQGIGESYLILRTSWLYSLRRPSFVTKVLEWGRTQKTLKIVDDQVSNPTCARMLAEVTAQALAMSEGHPYEFFRDRRGVYHLAGSGYTSRFEWAKLILENDPNKETQVVEELVAARTADFPTPAERPLFSALSCDMFKRVFNLRLPDWQIALNMAMESCRMIV